MKRCTELNKYICAFCYLCKYGGCAIIFSHYYFERVCSHEWKVCDTGKEQIQFLSLWQSTDYLPKREKGRNKKPCRGAGRINQCFCKSCHWRTNKARHRKSLKLKTAPRFDFSWGLFLVFIWSLFWSLVFVFRESSWNDETWKPL